MSVELTPFSQQIAFMNQGCIDARIRYRLREGDLKLWFELIDPEKVLEDAFKGIQEKVKESLPECLLLEGNAYV